VCANTASTPLQHDERGLDHHDNSTRRNTQRRIASSRQKRPREQHHADQHPAQPDTEWISPERTELAFISADKLRVPASLTLIRRVVN